MDLCFDRSGVWKWQLTTRTSSPVPRSCVKRTWHCGTWRTSRQRQKPLPSAAAWWGRTGWVVRCTAVWYRRLCEVPLLSVHWFLQVEPCTAIWYSRLCEVPLLSVHWFLQVEPCTAIWYRRLCEVPLLAGHCLLQLELTMCPPWQATLL